MADKADDRINFTSSRFRDFCERNPGQLAHLSISQYAEDDLTRLDHTTDDNKIPALVSPNDDAAPPMSNLKCCCGRSECAYLEHNNTALGGLEKDLETAARLGQALLDRHEAYVKESQAEQARLSGYIDDLEDEKASLQDANHKMVVENRELLAKLEQLNTDFGESGKRVHELEDMLQSFEQEIRRLNGLTRQTQDLELRILDMERERSELVKDLEDGRRETRSTIVRWRESEQKVRQLEQEMQKIEWAARVDRERHEELVARVGRERALERELGLSEGRLKATAAMQTIQPGGVQKQVVSNFVRDILQDNANLQAGIAELRELLQSSNDEVQNLREQVMLHQPINDSSPVTPHRTLSLSEELSLSQSLPQKQVQQEVHVHHHYHTKLGNKKEKTPVRKTPKRRALMSPSTLASTPYSSGASTPVARPQRYLSTPHESMTTQTSRSNANRWSMQSTATASTYLSSMASSPTSHYDRNSSIFDRLDRGEESSRPTSPESISIASPRISKHREQGDDYTLSIFEEEDGDLDGTFSPLDPGDLTDTALPQEPGKTWENNEFEIKKHKPPDNQITPKPSMNLPEVDQSTSAQFQAEQHQPDQFQHPDFDVTDSACKSDDPLSGDIVKNSQKEAMLAATKVSDLQPIEISTRDEFRPLRRSNSHESLFSLSGMDIHLPQSSSRSTLALLQGHNANKHHFVSSPMTSKQAAHSASQPLATVTEYTATSRHGSNANASASVLALSGLSGISAHSNSRATVNHRGLIGSVGGWVSSKWGRSPTNTNSVADLRAAAANSPTPQQRPSIGHLISAPTLTGSSAASITPSTISSTTNSSGKRTSSATASEIPTSHKSSDPSVPASLALTGFMGRPPGINQMGPIPGFAAAVAAKKTPTVIDPNKVDIGVLKESLGE